MIWIAAILALFALLAALPGQASRLPARAIAFYFMISLTGQLFALPLLIVAGVLAIFAEGAAAWVLAAAAALAALAHWRNRHAGRLLLAAVGRDDLRIPPLAGLVPPAVGDSKVRRIKDVVYGEDAERNRLDLILPRTAPAGDRAGGLKPILIHIHGGAWVLGDKDQQAKPLLNHLAASGWLCVDLTYRLGPQHRCPAMIVDVLKAIAWVKAHAHEHGGDPERIALTGGSAGGHLSALAALAHDDPSFKPGFEQADCSVAMVLSMYGRYDFLDRQGSLKRHRAFIIDGFMAEKVMPGLPASCPELWTAMSPLDRVRRDAPPMLLTHGTGDTMLPFEDARAFAAELGRVSASPVVYVELPFVQHTYDMASSALTWAHVRAFEAFLAPLARADQVGRDLRPDGALAGERVFARAG